MKNDLIAILGALIGGAIGYFAFDFVLTQGLYALVLPGALAGLGAGVVRNHSRWVAVTCGLLATAAGLFAEYHFFPFIADGSLGYFITHIAELKPMTLLMIAVGSIIGFSVPYRRREVVA